MIGLMGKLRLGKWDWGCGEAKGDKGSSIGYIRKRVWCYGEVRVVGLLD